MSKLTASRWLATVYAALAVCVILLNGQVGFAGSAYASAAVATTPLYDRGATESCLAALPNAVVGLPPTTPPDPPVVFVYPLARDDISTEGIGQPQPGAHTQLGAWLGDGRYAGMLLSFFNGVGSARESLKSLAWLYGGRVVRNVVVTWDQKSVPTRSQRNTVLGCLRSRLDAEPASKRPPLAATLATFAGGWGGHTRGLSITSSGIGRETASDGCCHRVYDLTFKILSVSGTLTRATAVIRVSSFRRYEAQMKQLRVDEIGKLQLKDGIVSNTLTTDFFCSDAAWGATGACGA